MKILGISLVWILLSGSIIAPVGFLTASGIGGGQTANLVSTTISLSSSTAASATLGQPITFTATITPSTATGNVQLVVNGADFGSPVVLSGGKATFTTSSLPAGTYDITASYSGDANLSPRISNSLSITTTLDISGQGSTQVKNVDDDDDDDDKNGQQKNCDNKNVKQGENHNSQANNNQAASGGNQGDNSGHDNVSNVEHNDKNKHQQSGGNMRNIEHKGKNKNHSEND